MKKKGRDPLCAGEGEIPLCAEDGISYLTGENYRRFCEWNGPALQELRFISNYQMNSDGREGPIKDQNQIEIQTRKDIPSFKIPEIYFRDEDKFRWEFHLEMFKGRLDKIKYCEDD